MGMCKCTAGFDLADDNTSCKGKTCFHMSITLSNLTLLLLLYLVMYFLSPMPSHKNTWVYMGDVATKPPSDNFLSKIFCLQIFTLVVVEVMFSQTCFYYRNHLFPVVRQGDWDTRSDVFCRVNTWSLASNITDTVCLCCRFPCR